MKRYELLQAIAPLLDGQVLVVSSVGGVRVELYAAQPSEGYFVSYAMGLAAPVGLGLALALPLRQVLVLDGDGALIMNSVSLTTIAAMRPPNLTYVVFDNGIYESSGAGPTHTARGLDLRALAEGSGIERSHRATSAEQFRTLVTQGLQQAGPMFIHAPVEPGGWPGIQPLPYDAKENKYRFARFVERLEGVDVLGLPLPAHLDRPG